MYSLTPRFAYWIFIGLFLLLSACAKTTVSAAESDHTVQQPASTSITPSTLSSTDSTSSNQPEQLIFDEWVARLLSEAEHQGIHPPTLTEIKPYLRLNQQVIALDQQQPEFTQTFWTYLQKRLSELRIQAGKLQAFRYQSLLHQLNITYGLPPEILVAFWGLETNYGTYLGNFNALEALTTLAYNPRRSQFFRKELLAAIRIIDQGHIHADNMKSSWAGAVGQMQFMPSVFLKYATDANHDGKADLWHSSDDALTSAARYLQHAGWQAEQPWLQEVRLPKTFDYALADSKQTKSRTEWQQLGIQPITPNWQGKADDQVALILPAGYEGPAWIAWPNFNVIKRWNNSQNYAIAVSLLALRIAGYSGLSVTIPSDAKPWAKTFIVKLQQTLTNQGYDTGGIDGWFGSKSMQALRRFQQEHQLPADGYPNKATLQQLNMID